MRQLEPGVATVVEDDMTTAHSTSRSNCVGWLLAAAITVAAVAPSARAAMIEYDFEVVMTSGDLSGNVYLGSFTYDDKLIGPPTDFGGIMVTQIGADQMLTARFDFRDVLYVASAADEFLQVQLENGSIQGSQFAGLFWIHFDRARGRQFQFSGTAFLDGPFDTTSRGIVEFSEPHIVSEPPVLTLIGTGLGVMVLATMRSRSGKVRTHPTI
jgi:hypothetical protein